MIPKKDFLERLRIASPCNVGWENMTGDERTRFCDECRLHVYNVSEMTRAEVASLIARTEGRICARLYRRADGTVLMKDCPVGLRAFRKRAAKMAGSVLAAVFSLCSVAAGQSKSKENKSCEVKITQKVKRETAKDGQSALTGVVLDQIGAVVAGAKIRLVNEVTKKGLRAVTTDQGAFSFPDVEAGTYSLEVEVEYFKPYELNGLVIKPKEIVRVDVALQPKLEAVTVGVLLAEPEMIEHSNGTTIFRGDIIERLPLP